MLSGLRALSLSLNSADGLASLLGNPAAAGLRELNLYGPWGGPGGPVAAAVARAGHLTNLRRLSIRATTVPSSGYRALARSAHLASLVDLYLTHTNMDEKASKELIASPHLNQLRRLWIGPPHLTGPAFAALEERFGKDVIIRG
jgi:hypothetical protein